jgi:hypothetical protein
LSLKRLISIPALGLSLLACASDPEPGGTGGSSGSGGSAGQIGSGGSASGSGGSAGTTGAIGGTGGALAGQGGGAGASSTGGASASGGSAGTGAGGGSPTGGAAGSGGTAGTGGSDDTGGTGGAAPGGAAGTAGAAGSGDGGSGGSGGSGGGASFKCDNLALAPSMTGVPKPAGAVGGLQVLDWAGFKGAASFTFDDNTPSQIPNYNALKATGGRFTWFVVGQWLNGQTALVNQFKDTIADGQEVANHTYTHQSAASESDLEQAETFITQNFGVTAHSMAAPNCAGSWESVAPAVLFQNRGPCGKGNPVSPRDNTSPFALPAYLPDTGESAASMSNAITAGKWRLLVLHGFDSQGGTYQPVPIANVTGAMSKAVTDGYWVETMTNVGAYWQGQKAIPESASTSATWTLPDKFPPNMCVRITTTGGTVTQKGETIAWDSHGYYQISLDAEEVTIQ